MRRSLKAFTLLEIMIVTILLGVMGSLAIASYSKVYKINLERNMAHALIMFDAANKIYKAKNGTYWIPAGTSGNATVNVDSICSVMYGNQNDKTICSAQKQIWDVLGQMKPNVIDDFYIATNYGQEYNYNAYTHLTQLGPSAIMVADSVQGVCCRPASVCLATKACSP